MITARIASSHITSRRRSSRSMTTPVKGSISMAGTVWSTAKVPRAVSECVAFRMYQATAAEFIPLPTMEIRLAAKTKRSGRRLKLSRIFLLYLTTFPPWLRRHGESKKVNADLEIDALNIVVRRRVRERPNSASRWLRGGCWLAFVTNALAQRAVRRYDSPATQESSHLAYSAEAGYETVQGMVVAVCRFLFRLFVFSGMGAGRPHCDRSGNRRGSCSSGYFQREGRGQKDSHVSGLCTEVLRQSPSRGIRKLAACAALPSK